MTLQPTKEYKQNLRQPARSLSPTTEPAKNTNNNMTLITMVNYGSEIEMLIDAEHAHAQCPCSISISISISVSLVLVCE
jgi:hypothetical protein